MWFNKKSLAAAYGVGRKIFDAYYDDVKEFIGDYKHKRFTPAQIDIFVERHGPFPGYNTYKEKLSK